MSTFGFENKPENYICYIKNFVLPFFFLNEIKFFRIDLKFLLILNKLIFYNIIIQINKKNNYKKIE